MKMTKIRKNQLRAKLQDSRTRLMENYPFFAILLMYIKFVAVDNIRNISINGKSIFFNPDFIAKLNPLELDFILCHQMMHIVNVDIWRDRNLAGDDYHRACDILINNQLRSMGWKTEHFTHLGKLQMSIPFYTGLIEELKPIEILRLLPFKLSMLDEKTRRRYMTDSDYYWDYKDELFCDGIVVLDVEKMTKYVGEPETPKKEGGCAMGEGEGIGEFWDRHIGVASIMVNGRGKNAGGVPDSVKRDVRKQKKQVLNWKNILIDFVQEEVSDYSFTPPDRRYTEADFFLPDFNEMDYVAKDILFMADTSGSVPMEDLSKVYAEIKGAIEQFDGKLKGRLGFFDCEVTKPIPFESVEDLEDIVPYGGGGTSFEVIFDHVRENMDEFMPAMIVIFTDGYARFPEQAAAMNIPVLWLITNEDVEPPWGKLGRVV